MLRTDSRRLLMVLLFAKFFQHASLAVVPPLLPRISSSFGLSPTQAGSVIAAFGIARLVTTLPLGMYLKRVSRASQMVLAGVGFSFVGTALLGTAWAYPWLLVGRALVGVGHGTTYLATIVLIFQFCPRSHVGRVINLLEAVGIGSLVIHAFIGGVVGDQWGWRTAFAWAAASVIVSGVILIYGTRLISPGIWGEVANGEVLDRSVREFGVGGRQREMYALVFLISFTLSVCWTGVLTTLVPLYGGNTLGLSSSQIGMVLSLAYLLDIVLLFPAGKVMDRHSRTTLLVPALLVLLIGDLLLSLTGSFWTYLGVSTFFGMGFVIWTVPSTLVADLRLGSRQGMVLSLVRFVGDTATFLAPIMLGYLVERAGYRLASWAVALLLGGLLLFAILHLVRQHLRPSLAPVQCAPNEISNPDVAWRDPL